MCASISERKEGRCDRHFGFFSPSPTGECARCLNIEHICVRQSSPDSCKYPRALCSVFGNGIPRSEVQIQLLPSGHKLDYSETWSRRESPVCHWLQRLLARYTTLYDPSTRIPPQSCLIGLARKARESSVEIFGSRGREVWGWRRRRLRWRSLNLVRTSGCVLYLL